MRRIVRPVRRETINVLGVDPSLTSTGYAYRNSTGEVVTGTIDPGKLSGPWRLFYVRMQMAKIIGLAAPTIVVYEDYAMGKAKGASNTIFHIGELGGVLKTLFWENGIDVMLVAPTALKKAITGRGDADSAKRVGKKMQPFKPEMRAALLNTFKLDLSQNDEADAAGLMLMGEMRFGFNTIAESLQKRLKLDTLEECSIIQGRGNGLKSIAKKR